ncbi:hypothetical protein NC652_038199 [Populus alba x Populus x berolinensis]|nr:hypothetical protein NC652_038199 [Populus alba x Populus x berolinensis]
MIGETDRILLTGASRIGVGDGYFKRQCTFAWDRTRMRIVGGEADDMSRVGLCGRVTHVCCVVFGMCAIW